jgi:hypothetical protein
MGTPGLLAELDREGVIDRIAGGEYAAHIANELNVTKQALQYRLRNHPKYQEAREVGCELRIDRVMAHLASIQIPEPPPRPTEEDADFDEYRAQLSEWKAEVARVEFDLARAEKEWRAVSWQAEREFPHRWGQKSHVTVENVTDLGERLRRARERVLPQDVVDAEVVRTRDDAVIHCITDESAPK